MENNFANNHAASDSSQQQESTTQTGEKTFTQDDVNRIVQERLAKEKGKQNEDISARIAELDKRERKMNAVQKLRDNGLPDYLADALNMDTDEAFEQSMKAVMKMKEEGKAEGDEPVGVRDLIGRIGGLNNHGDALRDAFGLDG